MEKRKSFLGSARARTPITPPNISRTALAATHRLSRRRMRLLSQMRIFAAATTTSQPMLELFAIWVLLSSLDDLFLDFAYLYRWLSITLLGRGAVRAPTEAELAAAARKRIA